MIDINVAAEALAILEIDISTFLVLTHRGQSLTSNDGKFNLIMQTDGNLVLYKQGKSLWSTKTSGAKYEWRDPITGYTIRRSPQVLTVANTLLRLTDYNQSHWFWFSNIQQWTNATKEVMYQQA